MLKPDIQKILASANVEAFEVVEPGPLGILVLRTSNALNDETKIALAHLCFPSIIQFELFPEQLELDFKEKLVDEEAAAKANTVTHPAHYNTGRFEVIEIIEDQGLNFQLGNAVKYICRAGKKDPTKVVEDLRKAVWYLEREIENQVAKSEGRDPARPNDMNPRRKRSAREYGFGGHWVEIETQPDEARSIVHLAFEPDDQATVRSHLDSGDRGIVYTRL